jgi:hypothetical protein
LKIIIKYRNKGKLKAFWRNYQVLVFSGLMMLFLSSCYKMKVEVTSLPENTPVGDPIYISGNFNNWDPGDERFRLQMNNDSVYYVNLPTGVGEIDYKFTRGDWTTVEKDACGNEIDNRTAYYGKKDIIKDTIESWNDLPKINCPHVTLVLEHIPANTPAGSVFSVAGTMNNWEPGMQNYEFHMDTVIGKPVLDMPRIGNARTVEYKITRGSMVRVESDELGNEIPARILTFGEADTVYLDVKGWEDLSKLNPDLLTIILTKIPSNTPPGAPIYLAGNINNWYPKQSSLRLEKNSKGEYFIKIPKSRKELDFKFTRGDWSTVETDKYGYDIDNRVLNFNRKDTVYLQIASWKDLSTESNVPVHVVVESYPDNFPSTQHLYIAGNFNGWDPGDRKWQLKKNDNGTYSIDIPRGKGTLEFKITRGNWGAVECKPSGEDIPNRTYQYQNTDEIKIRIQAWKDKI